jgi:hypothetical protein
MHIKLESNFVDPALEMNFLSGGLNFQLLLIYNWNKHYHYSVRSYTELYHNFHMTCSLYINSFSIIIES